ncbi:galactose mutarotase [Roseibium porphyridii]|uniref:Galactose mutarotase n=1 Tax=Roseibium porphyridii TaxID=2866279 RepID=A0ABY8F5Z9_9HYPH|nr:aldose epimerase family protein [Roseibium sp. KMA01]WFE89874.1 galactose mutarotase [Roseibium sp. KMA01]
MQALTIQNSNLMARVIPYGASLSDLRLSRKSTPLVLGYDDPALYPLDGQFMGAVIGRYGNRIAGGQFTLNDQLITVEQNECRTGHLHGGRNGFWNREWDLAEQSTTSVTFKLESPDGDAGFPGRLTVSASYEIVSPATLRLTCSAESDKDTILNICHHPYFNFSGTHSIAEHRLEINAHHYLPSSNALIPTGKIAPVEETLFDFRKGRPLSRISYNNTYCLNQRNSGVFEKAARLSCNGISMDLWTTQPGLHLYNGYKLHRHHIGHLGLPYPPCSGICLEPQGWPNSPNEASFPSTLLSAGERYEQTNEYRFQTRLTNIA